MIFFSFMLVMPLLPLYMTEEFGAGKHTIGVVLSGYTVTALFARLFSGYIVDTFNRRTVLLLSYGLFACFFLGYLIGGSMILFAIVRTMHGAPFGTTTVANSTVAIDVLPSVRRAEGIGYYGLANNLGTAISPTIGLFLYEAVGNFQIIFLLSFFMAALGVFINYTVSFPEKTKTGTGSLTGTELATKTGAGLMRLDRFFLVKSWSVGLMLAALAFPYGVISTYIAIYAKEQLGLTKGAGAYFLVLSVCLMLSRLTGGKSLRQGKVIHNAAIGMSISVFGYLCFASFHNFFGVFANAMLLGLGNGHMMPAVQNMFVNLAPHNRRGTANASFLTSWDLGVGLGVLVGGIAVELCDYYAAFWTAFVMNALGVAFFFAYVKKHYNLNKLY
ncbi:MAG: MFS transporter [Prevotella sp.]|nr:MFS transporter [Prevotella sp.]